MTEIPRWTISELMARYTLEPTLKDVFVEGEFDQDVLSRCFLEASMTEKIAYVIDTVDIPRQLLTSHKFTEGNKQRVIVLARELAELPVSCGLRCLVDRDLDHLFGPLEQVPRLIWTDYASLELYFFSEKILRDLLLTVGKAKISQWDSFINSFVGTLKHLYAIRLADRELTWNLRWISFDRCLKIKDGNIQFAVSDYINRVLLANKKSSNRLEFESIVTGWHTKLGGDPRNFIRGHDLIDLLAWSIDNLGGLKEFASEYAIQRVLVLIAGNISELSYIV